MLYGSRKFASSQRSKSFFFVSETVMTLFSLIVSLTQEAAEKAARMMAIETIYLFIRLMLY